MEAILSWSHFEGAITLERTTGSALYSSFSSVSDFDAQLVWN